MSHAMATTPRRPRHFSEAGAWAESGHHTDEGRCSLMETSFRKLANGNLLPPRGGGGVPFGYFDFFGKRLDSSNC